MTDLPGQEAPGATFKQGDRIPVGQDRPHVGADQGGEPKHTDVELLAMKMGWNPEHSEDSGRPFKSAEQYILDTKQVQDSTVETLKDVKKTNQQLVAGMQNLKEHYGKITTSQQATIDAQIEELRKTRDQAIDDADKDKVRSVDTQIENLQKSKTDLEVSAQQAQSSDMSFEAQAAQWQKDNPWYNTDPELRNYVDAQADRFRGLSQEMYFQKLKDVAVEMFPEKFKAMGIVPNGQQPAGQQTGGQPAGQQQAVVGGQTRQTGAAGKKTYGVNDLTPEPKKWAKFYESMKVMSVQEYVDDQVKIGNIQGMQQQG